MLDGVIRANTTFAISAPTGRVCATSATVTTTMHALMRDLDLPRGEEREVVVARDRIYELNGEDSRTLAAVGTFRVVPEQDINVDQDTLGYLRDDGLIETVDLDDDGRGLVLTKDGRDLLDSHTLERDGEAAQRLRQRQQAPARSTTIRISTRRTAWRKPVSEISTATLTFVMSSSSRT